MTAREHHPQTTTTTSVVSLAPVVIASRERARPLEVRVSAPHNGRDLPVIVLSHGHGPSQHLSSLDGYGPLASAWAAAGFLVVQPTHLDSTRLGLRESEDEEAPLYWRSRAHDVTCAIDGLDVIEDLVAQYGVGIDTDRVAVAGHSMGGHTASLILGMRSADPVTGEAVDLADARVRAGVVMAGVGRGGEALSEHARTHYPCFEATDFSHMTTPALVVAGDQDTSEHLTVDGARWHTDPYHLAPGPKSLLMLREAGHGLGGVSGWDAAETTDESPERVRLVSTMSAAYLRTHLGIDPTAWATACAEFERAHAEIGRVESK